MKVINDYGHEVMKVFTVARHALLEEAEAERVDRTDEQAVEPVHR